MNKHQASDYSSITEFPGLMATHEQRARLYQRYHFATRYAKNAEVLEVACGTGIGLGYLAQYAKRVVGIDIDDDNLKIARTHYKNAASVLLQKMDAHHLQTEDNSFDLVLFFESVYYMQDAQRCISEIHRTLRRNGALILCTVNSAWEDFHPSPYAVRYYSAPELFSLLKTSFNEVTLYGAFPVRTEGLKAKMLSYIKKAAIYFDLIPGSLKLRSYLKRIFLGQLAALPTEVYNDMALYDEPVPIQPLIQNKEFTIIYAIARK